MTLAFLLGTLFGALSFYLLDRWRIARELERVTGRRR